MARIAAMAALKDAALGEELFKQAREQVSKPSHYSDDDDSRESYAAYAFYHAPLDPAESRLLIETEWARRTATAGKTNGKPNDGSDYMRIQRLAQLATAMAAVDPDRALEMLKSPLGQFGLRLATSIGSAAHREICHVTRSHTAHHVTRGLRRW
jgi:hypothetical protein